MSTLKSVTSYDDVLQKDTLKYVTFSNNDNKLQ